MKYLLVLLLLSAHIAFAEDAPTLDELSRIRGENLILRLEKLNAQYQMWLVRFNTSPEVKPILDEQERVGLALQAIERETLAKLGKKAVEWRIDWRTGALTPVAPPPATPSIATPKPTEVPKP